MKIILKDSVTHLKRAYYCMPELNLIASGWMIYNPNQRVKGMYFVDRIFENFLKKKESG